MRSVYKYTFNSASDYEWVEMPAGSRILSVANQRDQVCMWALVDTSATEQVRRKFKIALTGEPVVDFEELQHLGTVLLSNGSFVVHVFEVLNAS